MMNLSQYLALYLQGKAVLSLPPSQILYDYIKNLADKCLLPPDEVKLWLQHLQQVAGNRKKGAEKAKVTRRGRKAL